MKKLFVFLFVALGALSFCACDDDDDQIVYDETEARAFLERLFADTNGVKWRANTLWNTEASINGWYGVSFKKGRLEVGLEQNNLNGPVDFAGCSSLVALDVDHNMIPSVKVSGCPVLLKLDCEDCVGLTGLDVTQCPLLSELDCDGTEITELDLSGDRLLTKIECARCPRLTKIDLTATPMVGYLDCNDCPALCELDLSQSRNLKRVTALRCDALKTVYVWEGFVPIDHPGWMFGGNPEFVVRK